MISSLLYPFDYLLWLNNPWILSSIICWARSMICWVSPCFEHALPFKLCTFDCTCARASLILSSKLEISGLKFWEMSSKHSWSAAYLQRKHALFSLVRLINFWTVETVAFLLDSRRTYFSIDFIISSMSDVDVGDDLDFEYAELLFFPDSPTACAEPSSLRKWSMNYSRCLATHSEFLSIINCL